MASLITWIVQNATTGELRFFDTEQQADDANAADSAWVKVGWTTLIVA